VRLPVLLANLFHLQSTLRRGPITHVSSAMFQTREISAISYNGPSQTEIYITDLIVDAAVNSPHDHDDVCDYLGATHSAPPAAPSPPLFVDSP
jgi:hypothetical protein